MSSSRGLGLHRSVLFPFGVHGKAKLGKMESSSFVNKAIYGGQVTEQRSAHRRHYLGTLSIESITLTLNAPISQIGILGRRSDPIVRGTTLIKEVKQVHVKG